MMGGRGFAVDELKPVWERILRDDVADGTLSYGVRRFREEADRYLDELSEALDAGSWQPHPLVEMMLPGAKRRVLHIPVVEDRIVARRVLEMITPLVDPSLGRASFGYRPGLGVTDAVQEVVGLREEGFSWVVRTDVGRLLPEREARSRRPSAQGDGAGRGVDAPPRSLRGAPKAVARRRVEEPGRGTARVPALSASGQSRTS